MSVDFLVVSDDKFASRESILLSTQNAPVVGLEYGPFLATCISKKVERKEEHANYWVMTCEFDSSKEEQQPDPNDPTNPEPTTWLPVWKLQISSEDSETMWVDYTPAGAKTIANTAGELYDPLPNKKSTLVSWVFNQFENASQTLEDISSRHDRINSSAIRGFGQYKLLCQVEDAELGYYNGFPCWNVAYRLVYKRQTWKTKSYSWGWNYKDGGVLKPYNANSINIFGPLDAAGGKGTAPGELQEFILIEPINFNTFLR